MTYIIERATSRLPTPYGEYQLHVYEDTRSQVEHVALVLGKVESQHSVLTRVHSECITGDVFSSNRCDCGEQFKLAQSLISHAKLGVIIYLRGQEGRGIGLSNKIRAYALQDTGLDTVDANLALGLPIDNRQYDIAAEILSSLQVSSIRLLSNNPKKSAALSDCGVTIDSVMPLEVVANSANTQYLMTKKQKLGHHLSI
jgi:GTP cyclohydrolase II